MQAGIDEAGRGPVVGPLVVGLVAVEDPARLAELGVRDSKQLTPSRREVLYDQIRAGSTAKTLHASAAELDEWMLRRSLNRIELEMFATLGDQVDASTYYLDACDTNAARFGVQFAARLARTPAPRVISEHKADARYPVVSAASIIAKVERDREIANIARRLEPKVGLPLGSGYAHDEVTRAFLAKHLEVHGKLPPEARQRWATSKELTARREQQRLWTP